MKLTIQLLLCFCLIQWSCSNDDNNDNQDIDVNANLIGAEVSFSSLSDLTTIDLETGNTITIQGERLIASVIYENSFIGLLENRLIRSSDVDFSGEQLWEIDISDGSDSNFDFNRSQMIIHNGVLYLNYKVQVPDIPSQLPILAAIDATTGTLLWSVNQLDYEFRRIAVLNNTIITAESFESQTRITSRDISNGSILNEWPINERISHLIPGINEIIVMSWNNAVYSIDQNLNINWSFSTEGANVRKGLITDNQFLFHSRDQNIYALNLQFGNLNWSQNLPDLFIENFFGDGNTLWSVTRDFTDNTLLLNEVDINNGTIFSTSTIPIATENSSDIELVNFDDYLFIITSQSSSEEVITQLVNFISQEVIWQNTLPLTNISIVNANILLGESRFARSSFF